MFIISRCSQKNLPFGFPSAHNLPSPAGHRTNALFSQQLLSKSKALPSQVASLCGCRGCLSKLRLRATPFASFCVLQHSRPPEKAYGCVVGHTSV